MANDHIISFRCSDEEWEKINFLSKDTGLKKSELIRLAITSDTKINILKDGTKIVSLLFNLNKQISALPNSICEILMRDYHRNFDSSFNWYNFESNLKGTFYTIQQEEEQICQLLESLIAKITPTKK